MTNYAIKTTHYNNGKETVSAYETTKEAGYGKTTHMSNGFSNLNVWKNKKDANEEIKRLNKIYGTKCETFKATKKVKTTTKIEKTFTVVELAKEMGIDPKKARAKLRKANNVPTTATEGKWIFDAKHKATIAKIIK